MSCGKKLVDFLFGKPGFVDDRMWQEVGIANSYAVLMAYLSMAVKGMGFVVLTWSTVVLLGGFVTELQQKDLWCIAFITLVQTAGFFDVSLTKKLSYLAFPIVGYTISRTLIGFVVSLVQVVVFAILLCPLAAVYMFGLYFSAGISVWRLRQHDYGSYANGHGNLKVALYVLYSLALLQGVIFCYKTIIGFAKESIVTDVVQTRYFDDQFRVGISGYLQETIFQCEKDPSSVRGRNLITYAVDLMGSTSPDDYLSGVRVLDTFASNTEQIDREWQEKHDSPGVSDVFLQKENMKFMEQEHVLMKHLIMSASSTDILQKLLQTLGYRSIYGRDTKERAARIVASIAEDIRLQEFPTGIADISTLIDTFEEYHLLKPYQRDLLHETYEQDWHKAATYQESSKGRNKPKESYTNLQNTYKELMVQGFRILWKLATNFDNCRVMIDTPCLLSKIMAPVTSDLLHYIDHVAWCSIVEGALKVMAHLTAATGQTGTELHSEISSSKEAISTMMKILECDTEECKNLQKHVIWILGHLYMDTSLCLETTSRTKFTEILVSIVTDDKEATQARQVTEANRYKEAKRVAAANREKEARRLTAANTLVALSSKIETTATVIMKANDNAVNHLTTMIFREHKGRLTAAQILEYLCIQYTNNDESLRALKKAMIDAVPKVLGEIVCGDSQVDDQGNDPSSSIQRDYKASDYGVIDMLSLCVTVCDTFISEDQDLVRQFDAISLPKKLIGIVDKNKQPSPDRLRILKLTCKMVISMMKHRGTYVRADMENLMVALSTASKELFLLDGSMVFDVTHNNAMALKPLRSLTSLVKKRRNLRTDTTGFQVETLHWGTLVIKRSVTVHLLLAGSMHREFVCVPSLRSSECVTKTVSCSTVVLCLG